MPPYVVVSQTVEEEIIEDIIIEEIIEEEIIEEVALIHNYEYTNFLDEFNMLVNVSELPSGDYFQINKVKFTGSGNDIITFEVELKGENAVIYYLDEESKTFISTSELGDMPLQTLYIKTDNEEMIINPCYIYETAEKNCLIAMDEYVLPINISETESGIICTLSYPNIQGYEGHHYYLISSEVLIDNMDDEDVQSQWAVHLSNIAQRFCYDGYYYESPTTYLPYAENMFWRNPAAYTPSKFVNTGTTRAEESLGYAMINIVSNNASENGTFLTDPQSTALLRDNYGMNAGFYDTRFNTEINKTMLNLYVKTGDTKFLDASLKMLDFFVEFANNHNYTFTDGDIEGILVEDYYHEDGDYTKVHSSLNHQIAEINTLYLAYSIIGDIEYLSLAGKMLNAVSLTRDLWLKDDGSLEYAYMPDGTMGLHDYPYLTYNDLFQCKEWRENLGLLPNEAVEYLLINKKAQMDRDGITGYME